VRRIVLLGSTGSIGTQTLDVIGSRRDRFDVVALAASGGNIDLLAEQVARFRPSYVALARAERAADLEHELAARGVEAPRLLIGPGAAAELAALECDVVVNAITGAAGLEPTLAALESGRTLALANKESLVIGGRLVTDLAAPEQLVAVDSEHSAMAQCLRAGSRTEVDRIVLTASGGPFRGWTRQQMWDVTPEQAAAHPTWSMGQMNTLNSATLVNKGLELIEASLLFDVPAERIDVTVHPQSIVHSMVTFTDGATIVVDDLLAKVTVIRNAVIQSFR